MKHIWKIHALLVGPECVKVEADTDTKGKDVSTSSSNAHAKDKHVSDFGGLLQEKAFNQGVRLMARRTNLALTMDPRGDKKNCL